MEDSPTHRGRFSSVHYIVQLLANKSRDTLAVPTNGAPTLSERHTMATTLSERRRSVESHSRIEESFAVRAVGSAYFLAFVNIAIIISSALMGLEADAHLGKFGTDDFWNFCEYFFTFIFTMEMLLKVGALRQEYFRCAWNLMDFVIVVASVVNVFIPQGQFGALKIFRLLRLFRIARLMKAIPELRMVVEGMAASMRAVFWVVVLLMLVVYAFAIFCIEVVGSSDKYAGYNPDDDFIDGNYAGFNNYEYFGTLQRGVVSLLGLSLLAEWSAIRPVYEVQWFVTPLFFALICISSFGIVNVIIGVIVEHTNQSLADLQERREARHKKSEMDGILRLADAIWEGLDEDGSGEISKDEMGRLGSNPAILGLLKKLDFPKGFTSDELHTMLDQDGEGGISKREFVTGMHRLIFGNEFQKACLAHVAMGHIKAMQVNLVKMQAEFLEEHFQLIQGEIRALRATVSDRPASHREPADDSHSPARLAGAKHLLRKEGSSPPAGGGGANHLFVRGGSNTPGTGVGYPSPAKTDAAEYLAVPQCFAGKEHNTLPALGMSAPRFRNSSKASTSQVQDRQTGPEVAAPAPFPGGEPHRHAHVHFAPHPAQDLGPTASGRRHHRH